MYSFKSAISSYWNKDVSSTQASEGGTGKDTEEMKSQLTYSGWDFENTWDIIEGETYPFLRTNPQEPSPK